MCWMTKCVTNVKGHDVEGNLLPFSVPMLPACNTTVNIVGRPYTLDLAVNSTNHQSRKELIDLELYHLGGVRILLQTHFLLSLRFFLHPVKTILEKKFILKMLFPMVIVFCSSFIIATAAAFYIKAKPLINIVLILITISS